MGDRDSQRESKTQHLAPRLDSIAKIRKSPPMRFSALLAILTLSLFCQAQTPLIPVDPKPDREPAYDKIEPAKEEEAETEEDQGEGEGDEQPELPEALTTEPKDDGTRVSVLGYHEFSTDLPDTAMRIGTTKFRRQMEALRDLGLPVISMAQFHEWKTGDGEIPPKSFLITIDDGWKSVYTDAFPIFKEMNFPFTIFLYKNYVDGGGRALTTAMIEEMLASGLCTIGSHSVSHPFPSQFKKAAKNGPEASKAFITKELGESKSYLEKTFGVPIPTYAYPGGYVTDDMFPIAEELGYELLFTVNPGMTRRDTLNHILPRFIILGNRDSLFELATTFRNTGTVTASDGITTQTTPFPVIPEPGALIAERLPLIAAELSEANNLDPESLVMRVAGFGKVPAVWNEEDQTFSWQVNRALRTPSCQVSVQWRQKDHSEYELPMRWSFRLDLAAAYQPQ